MTSFAAQSVSSCHLEVVGCYCQRVDGRRSE